MSDVAIKVEGLGKKFSIAHQKSGDLRSSLSEKFSNLFGTRASSHEEFWALKDVSFEIKRGEAVGIIGRNGAGKSTLLKILSRITDPSTGRFEINGRVSSLLEVGTGFHAELTGRENIYLNGTILGMKRKEIKAKFDEIVAFSGVEKFLDTPVKHYSSGMKVRLAFSVAAHLDPDILIIDEVLAVGDAEFQKKCLGKMDEVSKSEGRTVVFVSHNMNYIINLCNTAILLQDSIVVDIGKSQSVVSNYLRGLESNLLFNELDPDKKIQVVYSEIIVNDNSVFIDFKLKLYAKVREKCSIDLIFKDKFNNPVGFASIGSLDYADLIEITPGYHSYEMSIDGSFFAIGQYLISVSITKPNVEYFDQNKDCIRFELTRKTKTLSKRYLQQDWNYGSFNIPLKLISNEKNI